MASTPQGILQDLVTAGVLITLRFGSALVTMPVFSSPGIPARVKAVFLLTISATLTPLSTYLPGAQLHLTRPALLGEVAVGLFFGVSLALLQEALLFAASLMGSAFSFSLANLVDPNSMVETEVLGSVIGWLGVLVLLGAGLHRTMLSALMHTLISVPPGCASLSHLSGNDLASMGTAIFRSGVQLAAPVTAAALLVEVAVGIVGRMAPALPAQIASVPVKTIVSYVVFIAALSVWPRWIEGHFNALLDAAQKGIRA